MTLAPQLTSCRAVAQSSAASPTLVATGINHALHDGYTDLIYVLLPVLQSEFGLGYVALGLLRTLYSGTMAALQIPSSHLGQVLGARTVLVLGTLLSAAGYIVAGASGGLFGLCAGLALGGAGSCTQHPLASAVIARAYGRSARGPLGTYNFTGDLGKASLPPLVGLLLTLLSWRMALWVVAGMGVMVALGVGLLLPRDPASSAELQGKEMEGRLKAVQTAGLPYLVAVRDDEIVGYVYATAYRARPAYRHTIENSAYVAHAQHRSGVGTALLTELITRCEKGPGRQMVAVIGDSANATSIGLHSRLGFAMVGTLCNVGFKHGQWVDTILMQRALNPRSVDCLTVLRSCRIWKSTLLERPHD